MAASSTARARLTSRRRGCLYRLIALLLSLLFSCALLEIGARLIFARQIRGFQASVAADPAHVYNLFEPDPELGWRHRPGAEVVMDELEDQPPHTITINAQGLYDLDYAYEHPADGFRVLVLGDSYVEGVQVPLHDRSFQALEDAYQARSDAPYEIIEMGVARYSPAQYYRVYQLEGQRYEPDVVLVMLYLGNDLEEMHPQTGHSVVLGLAERTFQYTLEDGQLVEVDARRWHPPSGSSRVSAPLPVTRWAHLRLHDASTLYKLLATRMSWQTLRALNMLDGSIPMGAQFEAGYEDPLYAQVWPVFEAVLVVLRDEAEANGAEFAVVLAPHMYAVHPDWYFEDFPEIDPDTGGFDPLWLESRVADLLDAHDIAYFSLTPALQAAAQETDEPLYYHDNSHWNAAGHRAVTAALDEWFEQMGWSPEEP